jgi:hypothetical protein
MVQWGREKFVRACVRAACVGRAAGRMHDGGDYGRTRCSRKCNACRTRSKQAAVHESSGEGWEGGGEGIRCRRASQARPSRQMQVAKCGGWVVGSYRAVIPAV